MASGNIYGARSPHGKLAWQGVAQGGREGGWLPSTPQADISRESMSTIYAERQFGVRCTRCRLADSPNLAVGYSQAFDTPIHGQRVGHMAIVEPKPGRRDLDVTKDSGLRLGEACRGAKIAGYQHSPVVRVALSLASILDRGGNPLETHRQPDERETYCIRLSLLMPSL